METEAMKGFVVIETKSPTRLEGMETTSKG
jgi:hypothetical protein